MDKINFSKDFSKDFQHSLDPFQQLFGIFQPCVFQEKLAKSREDKREFHKE